MKFTTILFATGIAAVQGMELISENPLCKYEKLSVTAWHNCNDFNGGSDPYKDSDCDMPCARAGRKEAGKFVHVSNYWGSNRCALQCYLK
ncbi:hypothetical protein CkaCkLH20_04300 [Colletotrichum karsti]|uniref:Uncharacterized protein n=1 Tax=Colletotrichum karsti TaxID=1095194 RepID=A0A9P6I7D2_9PEZI|nr:uncharacterized protein CkaCkLH20_04300 [Colletotrichum karsti]KAF9878262.1 hypothetical protein CkaCkLH20_04300 [Colletotrichum karsti]